METKQTFNDWTLDLEDCSEVDGFFDKCFYKWVKKNVLSAGRFAKKRKQLENVLLGEMDTPYYDMRGAVEDWFYSLPVSIDGSLSEDKKEEALMDFVEENFKKVPLNITREVKNILWDWVKEHKEMKESRRPTGRMLREDSSVSAEEIARRVKELGDYSTNIELWKVYPLTDNVVDIYYVNAKEENRDGSRTVWDLDEDIIEEFLGNVLEGTGWGVDDYDYPEFMSPEDRDEEVVHIVLKPRSFKESRRPRGRMLREDFLDPDDEDEDLRHDDEGGYDYEFDFDGARDSIRAASEAVKRVRRIFWDGEPEAAPESETAELYEKLTELRDAVEELINVVEP